MRIRYVPGICDDNDKNKLLYDPNQREQRRLGAFSSVQNYDENEIDDVRDEELEKAVTRIKQAIQNR